MLHGIQKTAALGKGPKLRYLAALFDAGVRPASCTQ